MADLIPPDLNQCQAEYQEGSFMTLGPRSWRRCQNKPTVIATERDPGDNDQCGSMSLCDSCLAVMIEKMGCGFAEITKIEEANHG